MATSPSAFSGGRSRCWRRLDAAGTDLAMIDDQDGLRARGVIVATDAPVPYTCRYELATDPRWALTRLEVVAEGAGWLRRVRLERTDEGWRVPTTEQGDLGKALAAAGAARPALPGIEDPDRLADVVEPDLAGAPLFNTLPIRRLGLQAGGADGVEHRLTMAYVRLPSLEVSPVEQTYAAAADGRVRFSAGTFGTDLTVDADGYDTHYPGLAEAVGPPG